MLQDLFETFYTSQMIKMFYFSTKHCFTTFNITVSSLMPNALKKTLRLQGIFFSSDTFPKLLDFTIKKVIITFHYYNFLFTMQMNSPTKSPQNGAFFRVIQAITPECFNISEYTVHRRKLNIVQLKYFSPCPCGRAR